MKSTKSTAIVLLLTFIAVIPAFAFLASTPVMPERVGVVTVGDVTVVHAPLPETIITVPVTVVVAQKATRKVPVSNHVDDLGAPTRYGSKMLLSMNTVIR